MVLVPTFAKTTTNPKDPMSTLLLSHSACLDHLTPTGHPERPDRLRAVEHALQDEVFAALVREQAPRADIAVAALAHPEDYVEAIAKAAPAEGIVSVDADTSMSPGSMEALLRCMGAATRAVDEVLAAQVNNAFCAIRPPGHHAEKVRAMGFCLFNIAAVAAIYAKRKHGLERVAVVDFDVHHGNGTQDIFWSEPDLFYGSTHQMPLYPGTGAAGETGVGNIFNAPLRPGDSGEEFRAAMDTVILPALERFSPDLVIISAGFDAHIRDPLANLNLVEDDFAWATTRMMEVANRACEGRVVSLLEGGYDLVGLAGSVAAHVRALMQT
jgi:acetoin utilization deacetylase AcuC-like enzyme